MGASHSTLNAVGGDQQLQLLKVTSFFCFCLFFLLLLLLLLLLGGFIFPFYGTAIATRGRPF